MPTAKQVIDCPASVRDCAEKIGGYLGADHAFFDENGGIIGGVNSYSGTGYLVVGNYSGSSVFRITADGIERAKDTD